MIEDALFLGLGFCIATLIALAFLPLVWTRALRVTRQRLSLLVPGSQAEIDAAHDGLRAQAAVAQRRLEQRVEAEQHTAALTRTELGQRTVSLVAAEKTGAALRLERGGLIAELNALTREMRNSEGQRSALEKALHDADARIETAAVDATAARERYDELLELAEERRGAVAALETRIASLQAKLEDITEHVERLQSDATEREAVLAPLQGALDRERSETARLAGELAAERESLAGERSRAEERDRRLRQRSDALAAAEARMAEQEKLIAQRNAEIVALKERFAALEAELKARGETGAPDSPELAQADALLRSAIIAVGDDALRLLKPASEEQAQTADTPRFGDRQP